MMTNIWLKTCCGADNPCDMFRELLSILHSFGIEPAMLADYKGYFFQFPMPKDWEIEDRIAFHQQINEGYEFDKKTPQCISCGGIIIPLSKKCCMRCKNTYCICSDCNRAKVLHDCTYCQNE